MPIQKCKKPHENTEKFFTVSRRNQRLPLFDRQFEALPVGNSKIPSVSRWRIFRRLRCKKDWNAICNTQSVKCFTNLGRVKKKATNILVETLRKIAGEYRCSVAGAPCTQTVHPQFSASYVDP